MRIDLTSHFQRPREITNSYQSGTEYLHAGPIKNIGDASREFISPAGQSR
jgi:hypothetical protein